MSRRLALVLCFAVFGCSSSSPKKLPDGGAGKDGGNDSGAVAGSSGDGGVDTTDGGDDAQAGADGAIADGGGDAVDGSAGGYLVLVTASPPGPYIAQNLWQGVLAFTVAAPGAPMVAAAGIDKSLVADPTALAFRAKSNELLVGNRHGVNAADGVQGDISRFVYDRAAGTFTPHGAITGNGLRAVDQILYVPETDEIFVADFPYPDSAPSVSRFSFDAAGNAVAKGTIGAGTAGGVAIAPDGKRLYLTTGGVASNAIRQFDLSNAGAALADVTIAGPPRLFNMAVHDGLLYVAAVDTSKVYRLTIGASDDLTLKDAIAADGAVSVAFSPDGTEMFTAAHLTSEFVDRFSHNAADDTWTSTTKVATTSSLGSILALP
jgi:hypothetical protein